MYCICLNNGLIQINARPLTPNAWPEDTSNLITPPCALQKWHKTEEHLV